MARSGILDWPVLETPVAVIDFETTGLMAGADRVVEVSVVRLDPRSEPRLVLDSLVHPQRRVAATHIHGITDDDVIGAPTFAALAGDFVRAISGCVVAAHNVYFDMRFLRSELPAAGVEMLPPHLCTMYLRTMLGLGGRCRLEEACRCHGLEHPGAHEAASDAMIAAALMRIYLSEIRSRGLRTFRELAALRKYKFTSSFQWDPLSPAAAAHIPVCQRHKSRSSAVR